MTTLTLSIGVFAILIHFLSGVTSILWMRAFSKLKHFVLLGSIQGVLIGFIWIVPIPQGIDTDISRLLWSLFLIGSFFGGIWQGNKNTDHLLFWVVQLEKSIFKGDS